jgi:hypothetical protein
MIEDLKPYAEYKDSGLPWLGEVPCHWEVLPAFGAFKPNKARNIGMKENTVLSLSYGRIVIKPAEKLHGRVPESFETYQIVDPGDIVLRTTDLQKDHTSLRVGMVRDRGIITSAYLALDLPDILMSSLRHFISSPTNSIWRPFIGCCKDAGKRVSILFQVFDLICKVFGAQLHICLLIKQDQISNATNNFFSPL